MSRKDSLLYSLKICKTAEVRIAALISLTTFYLDESEGNESTPDSTGIYFNLTRNAVKESGTFQDHTDLKLLEGKIDLRYGRVLKAKTIYDEVFKLYTKSGRPDKAALVAYDYADRADHSIPYEENLKNFQHVLSLFEKTKNKNLQEELRIKIIDNSSATGHLDFSEKELYKLIEFYEANGIHKKYIAYEKLASLHAVNGDPDKELDCGLQMLKSFQEVYDPGWADFYYHRMAMIYRDLSQYKNSLFWAKKALLVCHDKEMLFILHSLITNLLLKTNKPGEALRLFKATHYNFTDTAGDYNRLAARIYGDCYTALKQYEKAEFYYLEMLKYQKMDPYNREHFYNANYTLGEFYVHTGRYDKGRIYLNKVLKMDKGIVPVVFLRNINYLLSVADSASGNFKGALQYFQDYKILNDSIFNIAKSKQITDIQLRYNVKGKDKDILIKAKDIALLKKQALLKETQLQNVKSSRKLTVAAIVVLLLLLGGLYGRSKFKQRLTDQLRTSREEINGKNKVLINLISEKDALLAEKDSLITEKEWLIREIHHRVKNNLQITISLLNLQSAYISNESALEAIRNSQMRMHSMSLIHQKLYQSQGMTFINSTDYIYELMNYLKESYSGHSNIAYVLNVQSAEIDVSQAVPVGLIINEAVTNAVKYAFPDGRRGSIAISFHQDADHQYHLLMTDDGVGLPAGFHLTSANTLGMNLMKGLSYQLNGDIRIENNNGTQISIHFKPIEVISEEHRI
ncbi:tetratricopeptide repeat-containing sensor histidine kinase [Mucilaginibacter celer]|nr:histidine kinase dimerization/phosphoacceptor domain -containing protein [Mucilaginibacter celer]